MRHTLFTPRTWGWLLCSAAAVFFSAASFADPPARVARLAQIGGTVSFSPAGEQDWDLAQVNRPVTTGDRLWADARSHVELQIGAAAARLGENTSVTLLNLDDSIAQFQLAQGTLNVRVRRIDGDQFYEVDTPNLAFSIRRVGDYRIDVDPSGNATMIQVRSGQGEAWGEGRAYTIDAGQQYTFAGEAMQDVRYDPLPQQDEFDRWCFDRNRREDAAVAARYVPPEMVGYSDLDEYGTWRNVEGYGTVWVPTQVAVDWVPYHYGRWGWVEPWGWTWIDDAPWGFAPFHYGRWAFVSSRWCWVPGPIGVRPVYAPALVAFVGGGGFSLSISSGPVAGIAWFPLGVGEVYRPAYAVSRNYFTNINVTNTVINTTYVTNVYNNPNVQVNYRNREVTNAITAVPANAFAGGQPIARNAVAVQRDVIERQPVSHVATVTPTHASVLAAGAVAAGAATAAAIHRPPERALSRQVVARTQPPAPPPSFAARSSLLSSQPGRPLDAERMKSVHTERPAEAPKVKMVSPNVTPRPLDKGVAKGGPGAGPGGPAGQAQGQAQEERAMKERKGGGPQTGGAPQPPTAAQERFKGEERSKGGPPPGAQGGPPSQAQERFRGGPPPGAQTGQDERASREHKGGPQTGGVPQPPTAAQERFKGEERSKGGPPPGAQGGPPSQAQERFRGGPPPGAQSNQEDRSMKERRAGGGGSPPGAQGGPPPGAQGGPPPQAQERFRGGPPPGAQSGQDERTREHRAGGGGPPPGAQGAPPPQAQERIRSGPPPGAQNGGPQPQAQERIRSGPPPGAQSGGPQPQAQEHNRGGPPPGSQGGPPPQTQERSRGGPPPGAQGGAPQGGPPQGAPQAQHQPQQQGGRPEGQGRREEGRGQGKDKDKEKEKEARAQ